MPRLSTPQNQIKTGLLRPSVRSLNLLLLFLHRARKPSLALHLFSQITSNSILVHPYAHSLVTRTLLQSGRFQEAKRFIFCAESDFGFTPKSSLFESLIHGLCVAEQNPDEALAILQECIQHHNFCSSVGSYRAVVSAFGSQGRFDRAVQILEAIGDEKNLFLTDNFICSSIISGFSRNGVPALGLEFYERAKVAGLDPNLVTFTTVVDALCREGRIDEACNLVRKMEDNGMVLDVVLYTCLIDGYMRRGEIMEGLRKHKFMMETGINPDAASYTSIIDGLCKEGSVEKVIGFLTEMENHDIQPNLVTYTTIIRGFCLRNKLEEALCLLRKAEELSFVADEFLYSIMIDGFCRRGDLDGAFNMLEEMEKKEIKVGSVTYNTVINSLCKIGQINKANEISNGFVNDNFTYSILLHGYLKETNVAGILEVW